MRWTCHESIQDSSFVRLDTATPPTAAARQTHASVISTSSLQVTPQRLLQPSPRHASPFRVTGSNILPSVHPSWAVSKARYNGLAGCRRRTYASACRASWNRQGQPRCLACNSPLLLFAQHHTTNIIFIKIQQHAPLAKRHQESTTER